MFTKQPTLIRRCWVNSWLSLTSSKEVFPWPGIHLSVIPHRVVLNQFGTLMWTTPLAKENRLSSPLNPMHRLSVHQSEHHRATACLCSVWTRTWDLHSCLPIHFCIVHLSWGGSVCLGFGSRFGAFLALYTLLKFGVNIASFTLANNEKLRMCVNR